MLKLLKFLESEETTARADEALGELNEKRGAVLARINGLEVGRITQSSLTLAGDREAGKKLEQVEADLAQARTELERLDLAIADVRKRRQKAQEREQAAARAAKVRQLSDLLAERQRIARAIEEMLRAFAPQWKRLNELADPINQLHKELAPERIHHIFGINSPLAPAATVSRLGRLMKSLGIDDDLARGEYVDTLTKPGSFAALESETLDGFKLAG